MLARMAFMKALNRNVVVAFNPDAKKHHRGEQHAKEGPMTVVIYVDTSKQRSSPDHRKAFYADLLVKAP